MGVKITHRTVNDMNFMGALEHLCTLKLEAKAAWNVARLHKQIGKVITEAREFYLTILKKYCELDEKGNPKLRMTEEKKDAEGKVTEPSRPIPGAFIFKENGKEAHDKEFADFLNIEVELKSFPINVQDLNVQVEPNLLQALEPIIANVELV